MRLPHHSEVGHALRVPTLKDSWKILPDLHGGNGFAVLRGEASVLDESRVDLTEGMLRGARAILGMLGAKLDSKYTPLPDAVDHHQHP